MALAYVGLGANLGDRLRALRRATARLEPLGRVEAVSPVYETEPVGSGAQPPFLNAVVGLRTPAEPAALLAALLRIEQDLGRVRPFPNAPRTIDLDLLFYDAVVLTTRALTLPHPRLHERAFVLVPLADIAPHLVHPTLGRSVAELLAALGPVGGVRRFGHMGCWPAPRSRPPAAEAPGA